ncbi:hypothetical protein IT411_00865 [Candidatus Peregrinibacteria bacterium]|nr:hypothetical protein [Candidatus Peregrinibacteria bacterium]
MKSLIKKVSTGLTTLVGSALYGYTVFAQGTGFLSPTDSPGRISNATGGEASARNLVLTIVNFFLGFLGLIAVLMVIYGGVLVLTAGVNADQAGKGKKILSFAAIGIIIILLSFAVVSTILGAASGQDA